MASRLYPITRWLFGQVVENLKVVGLKVILSPLVFSLMAIYITGLILLDRRQNGTRISNWLPARAHDAINRLLRIHKVSTRAMMRAVSGVFLLLFGFGVQDSTVNPSDIAPSCN